LASHGDCVIVGRGAAQILPAETTVRVRLVAPVEWRIAAMSEKLGVSKKDAARQMETIDHDRVCFVWDHFKKDPTDPRQYDLVLNSSRFSVNQCGDLIVEALHRLQAGAPNANVEPVAHARLG